MKRARQKIKVARIFRAMYSALSRHKLVGSIIRRTFEHCFCIDYLFLSFTQRAAVLYTT